MQCLNWVPKGTMCDCARAEREEMMLQKGEGGGQRPGGQEERGSLYKENSGDLGLRRAAGVPASKAIPATSLHFTLDALECQGRDEG